MRLLRSARNDRGRGWPNGNAVRSRDGRAAVGVCSDDSATNYHESEVREAIYPLFAAERMGRSLEVRRESENLPAVS